MNTLLSERKDRVLCLQLNRPKQLNALSAALLAELEAALAAADADDGIGAIILTGNGRAFAAGMDIAELNTLADTIAGAEARAEAAALPTNWACVSTCRKPILAAVNGMALGGGCELALMCDFIIAGESAVFAQPEIKLGTLPGIGATQRLVRAVGKAKAMELCLTGRQMNAAEAERAGLVARVLADEALMAEAWQSAAQIAAYSLPVVRLIKEAINAAAELPLADGLQQEQRLFKSSLALADRREGMTAFLEKRPPLFKHK